MRKFIIDTDTASDDAVALIMALREPSVLVEAVTVVAGNVPLDKALRNALISVERAKTYNPPVYSGLSKPLIRKQYTAEFVHGQDGLGDVGYADPKIGAESEHAVDAMLRIIEENPDEIELITLGPLTNVAAAIIKAPETMKMLKGIYTMGGTLGFPGNVSVAAEFNIYVDAEAAEIVFNSGVPIHLSPFENCLGDFILSEAEFNEVMNCGSDIAKFSMECNRTVLDFSQRILGQAGITLADPATMGLVLYPECIKASFNAYICVETKSEITYGQIIYDFKGFLKRPNNATVFKEVDGKRLKEKMIELLK